MSKTRGHNIEVRGTNIKRDVRGRICTQRVVGAWNVLAGVVVKVNAIVASRRLCETKSAVQRNGKLGLLCSNQEKV